MSYIDSQQGISSGVLYITINTPKQKQKVPEDKLLQNKWEKMKSEQNLYTKTRKLVSYGGESFESLSHNTDSKSKLV